ncbi:MAG: hypothetical protein COA94_00010 [Rickettsiales bacterium]|nr:MAG: hypothetical protein COA94_00010 [Rickettsiales bacterium]
MPKIALKVKAGARQNSINGIIEIDNKPYLKLSIKSSPEKGKANKMIIDFLAKEWGMRKSDLTIISGKTSQYKILHIKEP